MPNLKKRLDEAVRSPQHATPWGDRALADLVEWLNERYPSVTAWIAPSSAPRVRLVMLSPASRLNEAATLLVVQVLDSSVRVLGEGSMECHSEEDFDESLARLVTSDAFARTMYVMEERQAEPAEGILRTGAPRDRDPRSDIAVRVEPEAQKKIAEAAKRHEPVQVDVELLTASPIARGRLGDERAVTCLVSGGFVVALTAAPQTESGQALVRIVGTASKLAEN